MSPLHQFHIGDATPYLIGLFRQRHHGPAAMDGVCLLLLTAAEISLFDANNESINVQYKEEIYPIDRKIYKPCPLFVPSDMKQKGDPAVDFDVSFCRPFFSYREREIRFEWKKAQRI